MVMLSIITPVLNGRHQIENCLRSVIHQDCPDIEHYIVDGGSTDGTIEVVQSYVQEHGHIRWITERDRGQSDAMNKGIAGAKGEYLGFLNVDDTYEPGVLNRVIDIFKTVPEPSLLVGNCNVWNEKGILVEINRPSRLNYPGLLLGYAINPLPINSSAYFYHRTIHQITGGYNLDEDYVLDWDFLLRAVRVAHVHYFNQTWGNYYLLPGTKTYADIQSGMNRLRWEKLVHSHRRELPIIPRIWVGLQSALLNNAVGASLYYFYKFPSELPGRLKARIHKVQRNGSWMRP